jgi:hypothetical protein
VAGTCECGNEPSVSIKCPDADAIPRRLEPLPNLYTVPLRDGLKEIPKYVSQN